MDTRPTRDNTGITAAAILAVTALLGVAMLERAWLWVLAVSGWLPVLSIVLHHNYEAILALIVAFVANYKRY